MGEYRNKNITVFFDKNMCIHAGECVRNSPSVFDVKKRPWINVNGAPIEEIVNTVNKCPTGALTYKLNDSNSPVKEYSFEEGNNDKPDFPDDNAVYTEIKLMPNGPLVISGSVKVIDANGNETIKTTKFSLCRCGSSRNKPYCDGTHNVIDFQG